jgi:hypothetical protein
MTIIPYSKINYLCAPAARATYLSCLAGYEPHPVMIFTLEEVDTVDIVIRCETWLGGTSHLPS